MAEAKVGIIGGTNLYQMEGLTNLKEVRVETPFGNPSDAITLGDLASVRTAFLPRHGRGHPISPGELPARANIYALKSLGVECIIAVGSCGSLREDVHPLDLLIPDQLIDLTKGRHSTFFGDGIVAHVGFSDPFCSSLSDVLYHTAVEAGATVHKGGTFVVMEGPQFSSKAESNVYRSWGASIIGMTALPEAKLAREAEICYATLALVTDYDCWHESGEIVTVEMLIANSNRNADMAKKIIEMAVPRVSQRQCACSNALENAILTAPEFIPAMQKKKLELLIKKYVK